MSHTRKRLTALIGGVLGVALLAACGTGTAEQPGDTDAGTGGEDRGPITFAQGMDASGVVQKQLDAWNAEHPGEEVTFIELPSSSDEQRQLHIQNAQTKSDAYSVIALDNVWVAEFAANQWVDELPADEFPVDEFLPAVWKTGTYRDKVYAIPRQSDGGLLYYRTDLLAAAGIEAPPTTWAEMEEQCALVQATPEGAGVGCYAGQLEKYEGLTVNFAEAVNTAGGVITEDDGTPNVNTPEALAGLSALVDGFDSGFIPSEAITFKEEEGRAAFQAGALLFHRQWPYQWVLANKEDGSSEVAGQFGVTALPGMGDNPGASSLGGWNVAIAKYGKHKDTALDFIKWFTEAEQQKWNLTDASLAPVHAALYDDPELIEQFPYLPALKNSIPHAVPRPRVVNYGDVTTAIQEYAYGALTGTYTPEDALAQLQAKLEELSK